MRGRPSITVRGEGAGGRAQGQAKQTSDDNASDAGRSDGIDGRTTTSQKILSMMLEMKEQAIEDRKFFKEETQATRDELRATRDEVRAIRDELRTTRGEL